MCYAQSIGRLGYASGATPGGVLGAHALGHPIGSTSNCHHGLASAIVAGPAERINEKAMPARFATMAEVMGVDTTGMSEAQAADKCVDEVERLLADLDIKTGHLNEQVGLTHDDLVSIADKMTKGLGRTAMSADEVLKFLEKLL
jgi:alcohol dehydrogenase